VILYHRIVARPTIALMLGMAIGCSGTIDEGAQTQGLSPAQQLALNAWLTGAEPAFHTNTCDTCHEGQMLAAGAPAYLMGDTDTDKRDAAIATVPPVIDLGSPASSRVLVKQVHEGPALDAAGASAILIWIQYEHEARPIMNPPTTTPYTMMDCTSGSAGSSTCPINSIDLTAAGAAGAITFTEMPLEDDTYMAALTITAGAGGLHVVHPQFATVTAGSGSGSAAPVFDPQDRYFNIDMEIDPSGTLLLGTTTFAGFDHTDPLLVQFDTLTPKM
jgi:hypothetical protein